MDPMEQPLYACGLCDRTFIYEEVMNMHTDVMHAKLTKDKSLNNQSAARKIRLFEKLTCPYKKCNITCKYSKSLAKHIQAAHEPLEIELKARNIIDMSKICPHCGKILAVGSLSTHIKHVHTGEMHLYL